MMKRNSLRLMATMMLVVASLLANANPVDMRTAREVAIKFVNANTRVPLRGAEDLQLVTTYSISHGDAAFHIFNTPNGFVIVAADDCATPILGYSDEGQFDAENIPIQLQEYLQDFVEQIEYGIENHARTDARWALIHATGRLNENRDRETVGPLLTTTWGQGCYYNAMCPEDPDGPCDHVVTGCVATAMAQIMRYWGYPSNGQGGNCYTPSGYPTQNVDFGTTVYDWDNMPNSLNVSPSQEQVDAVATLMWHCGVSVDMAYSPYESGASNETVESALRTYFSYSYEMYSQYKTENPNFLHKVKECLDQSRPLYYSASNEQTGHAFVCDGYDSNDLLHFNWGWEGYNDGFFSIDALVNGYNNNHFAIFNIYPESAPAPASCQVNVLVEPSSGGSVSGEGQYSSGDYCTVTATPNPGFFFSGWMEDGCVVSSRPNYGFTVTGDRNLVAVFTTIDPASEIIQFADSNVKALCVANWDTNGDGELSCAEAAAVTGIGFVFREHPEIVSFDELRYFTGLTNINSMAFSDCTGLTSISIPSSVRSFGNCAFLRCGSLMEVNYTGNLARWCNIVFYNFYSNPLSCAHNFYINDELITELVIPETITVIKDYAFTNASLTSVTIPNTVTRIGDYAFSGCGSLASIEIPNSVISIGNSAFSGCGSLASIEIPNSVTSIGNFAFSGCGSLASIEIPNSVTSIGNSAFSGCGSLASIEIPNSVTSIGNYTFSWCSGLTSVILPESVTSIGDYAFNDCTSLNGVFISDMEAWCGIDFSNPYANPLNFAHHLYLNNQEVTDLIIPSSVSVIKDYTFMNFTGLHSVIFPNSVTSIGKCAFEECSGLVSVTIGNNVVSIGEFAFEYCSGLVSVTIGNNVVSIGVSAFGDCYNLNSLTIGNSVTSIGEAAFIYCSGLTTLYIEAETPPILGDDVFEGVPTSAMVFVPCGSVEAYQSAEGWNGFSNIIGSCNCTISVTTNPAEGGTVTGAGIYFTGDVCTVTATPNDNYVFLYWTENGNWFSSEPSVSFTVYGDRNLVAQFVDEGSVCNLTFDLYDSYGDGWNGNYLVVNYGNGFSEQLTLEDGSSGSFSRMVVTGSVVSLTWISGLFVNECSFDIGYDNGIQIYHGSFVNSSFQYQFMVDCVAAYSQHVISAIADPEEGGTVTGAGEYDYLSTCTLTAIPNVGFVFLYWEENGEHVSTETDYTFIVTSERTLTAHFATDANISFADSNVKTICVDNWDTNGDGELSYTEAAEVTSLENVFSGNDEITSFDELQYFVGLNELEESAFFECIELTSIVIPNSVTSIGEYAFGGSGLTTIEIPASVASIGIAPFVLCAGLEQIVVNVGNMYYNSRDNCNAIIETNTNTLIAGCMSTIIPNTVISIGNYAFVGCNGAASMNIPNSVTSIGEGAFGLCYGLTSVTIGNSVTSIGSNAFAGCGNLVSLTVLAVTPPVLGSSTFNNVNLSIPVYVPCGSLEAYQATEGWNAFTNLQEDCSQSQTQSTELPSGWSWWSPTVQTSIASIETTLGDNLQLIQAKDGIPSGDVVAGEMYKIQTTAPCTLTVTGVPITSATVTINPGENWFGFVGTAKTVAEAFTGFTPAAGDKVISQDEGFAIFEGGAWSGTLENLQPGKGYVYISNDTEPKTLVIGE